jgi:hypothetical protein
MKILIGILSAHHPSRKPYRDRARATYLKNSPIDYRFVLGNPITDEPDALTVHCDDRKEYMVLKNQGLFRYALERDYTHCLRVCDDTWVYPERLLENEALAEYDYAGNMPCKLNLAGQFKMPMKYYDYMHGGCGIWLSRKAMEMLAADDWKGPELKLPERMDIGFGIMGRMATIDWDDRWIGEVLKGKLSIDDPKRDNPYAAYADNGIKVFEDEMLFFDDDPKRPLTVHDPGTWRGQAPFMEEIKQQIKERNNALAY